MLKLNYLLILISIVSISSKIADKADQLFDDFVATRKRHYSEQEKVQRKQTFKKTLSFIDNKAAKGQIINLNEFADYTEAELAGLTGFIQQEISEQELKTQNQGLQLSSTPTDATLDYRDLGMVTPPKSQGSCGSCWAFAVASWYESELLKWDNNFQDLSEKFILDCSGGGTCSGGYIRTTMNGIQESGIPTEEEYAYTPKYNSSASICLSDNSTNIKLKNTVFTLAKSHHYSSDDQIKQILVQKGPVIIALTAGHSGFYNPNAEGIIDCSTQGGTGTDHAVLLVGWIQNLWIIKNSWGTNWGDNGYGYIRMDPVVDCNVGKYVYSGLFEDPPNKTYVITMTDKKNNGWHGNVFSFYQNEDIVASFGAEFLSGGNYVQTVSVPADEMTYVKLSLFTTKKGQIGFEIKDEATGAIVYTHEYQKFRKNQILVNFCTGECAQESLSTAEELPLTQGADDDEDYETGMPSGYNTALTVIVILSVALLFLLGVVIWLVLIISKRLNKSINISQMQDRDSKGSAIGIIPTEAMG